MNSKGATKYLVHAAWLPLALVPVQAAAQDSAEESGGVAEIIVTAQKREQSLNDVGITITAATGDQLLERGIASVSDLPRLVPGFTVQESAFNSTSFTLRGVGFFNSDLGTPPAVTVYVDEAPLPYPAMAKLAAFDLDRVEVLKGPQGTLFGQNATGGLVNYLAAKPARDFEAGFDAGYGRFDRISLGGFVSGPLSDTVRVRFAVQGRHGGPWQKSITRPDDELGRIRELQARATIEWQPSADFTSRLTLTHTHDGSENAAAQFIAAAAPFPDLSPPGFINFPVVNKPRAADWTPVRSDDGQPFDYKSDTNLYHLIWRNELAVSDNIDFVSITSYSNLRMKYGQDTDGTPFHVNEVIDTDGAIDSIFQEFRLVGSSDRFNWLVGANYTEDKVSDAQLNFFQDKDACNFFVGIDPNAYCDKGLLVGKMKVKTFGIYGQAEYEILDGLKVDASLRYNRDRRNFNNCAYAVTDHFADYWNIFRGGALPPTEVGDCYILDIDNGLAPVDNVNKRIKDNSVSWRAGLNWTARRGLLFYANVSRGYKAGTVPTVGAATTAQLATVPEESVLAYEAGFKASLFDRKVQLNGAAFYYDYKKKQLRGSILDPAFGPLEALVSIPESHAQGAELQLIVNPVEGLVFDTAVTYVDTKIDEFVGYDAFANLGDQAGTPFPFSPKWQVVSNVDYKVPVSESWSAFLGGTLTHNSKTYSGIGALPILQIDAFTVLDLRAGVESEDGRYRVWAWGKNVTDKYYWNNVFAYGNAVSRYVAQPATYGVSFSYRFR